MDVVGDGDGDGNGDGDADLAARLKVEGRRLGFDQVGIAPAVPPPGYPHYLDWLRDGHAAGMDYLERQSEARSDPAHLLEGVRSIIVVSFVYGRPEPVPEDPRRGKVARYARGGDYHPLLWRRLEDLLGWLEGECPGLQGRAVADTAPLLEREYARLAGLGWIGKNTLLIDRRLGSFTVLGALLVDRELLPDRPHETSHCGTCTRCLDACPTDAFAGPFRLDSRRCLSYWTIEHKGLIAEEMADRLEGWAFGCDVCQDVCPWNRKAPPGREPELQARDGAAFPDLIEWLEADPAAFSASIRKTALSRAKRSGLLRNAASILGARGAEAAVPALARLLDDPDPVIATTSAWALGRIGNADAILALEARRSGQDPSVVEATRRALARVRGGRGEEARLPQGVHPISRVAAPDPRPA